MSDKPRYQVFLRCDAGGVTAVALVDGEDSVSPQDIQIHTLEKSRENHFKFEDDKKWLTHDD